jgi:hypothetical protein
MKRYFGAIAASVLLSSSAHAAIYTFEYTATVSSIAEYADAFGGGTPTSVLSTSIPGGTISIGDTVTGKVSYDSNMPISFESHDASGNYVSYGYVASLQLTADFAAANVHFSPNGYQYGGQSSFPSGSPYNDSFGLGAYRYAYLGGGGMSQEVLGIHFEDSTHTKFDGHTLPGAEIATFDSNNMVYDYANNFTDQKASITGNITSVHLVSAVPEPESYAMLLGGLALLAWRRRSRAHA